MKIISAKLEDKVITITLDTVVGIERIFIDSVDNYDKINNSEVMDHTEVHNTIPSQVTFLIELIEEYNAGLIITIVTEEELIHKFIIDDTKLYKDQVALLNSFCNTCLDNNQKLKMVISCFRLQLLLNAVLKDLLDDCVELYTDLMRVLNVDNKILNINKCSKCCGNCCSL